MKKVYGSFLAGLILAALAVLGGLATGQPLAQQPDPTAVEGTIQAYVEGFFTQTAQAPLAATAQARFDQALIATVEAETLSLDRDFTSGGIEYLALPKAFGARKGFWQVLFTIPIKGRNPDDYTGGIDTQLAAAISRAKRTIDIAAFEFDNTTLGNAILKAHADGVRVRIVTDNQFGACKFKINPDTKSAPQLQAALDECLRESVILQFIEAGIPVVDDNRSGLMHNKFMILDGAVVWMGSMNYTFTGSYKNYENVLALRSPEAVAAYQGEFDEMFIDGQFGRRSPKDNSVSFEQQGAKIQILFASEDPVNEEILKRIQNAEKSIRFLAFSFTLDTLRNAMLAKALEGVTVEGVFEWRGSGTASSALSPLFCANIDVRRDGNMDGKLHDKVIIIDDRIVMTGSFNFSSSATLNNDENMIIIDDPDLAAQYNLAFDIIWNAAFLPEGLACDV